MAERRVRGLDGKIEMPGLDITLGMAAIYEGVAFPIVPSLAFNEDGP